MGGSEEEPVPDGLLTCSTSATPVFRLLVNAFPPRSISPRAPTRERFIGIPCSKVYFFFATTLYLIPSYVARGRTFFCTSSSFRWYGRPLMISSE